MQTMLPSPSCAVLLALFATPVAADVLEVGQGKPFASIKSALVTASDGDVVLVSTGAYSGFSVPDLSVTIVADSGAQVAILTTVEAKGLSAGRELVLAGMEIERLELLFNAGAVRVEACTVRPAVQTSGVEVALCSDVAFVGCTLSAGDVYSYGIGGYGLFAFESTVALYDCEAFGGKGSFNRIGGPAQSGGDGVLAVRSTLFLSGCTIAGGEGAHGFNFCSDSMDGAKGGAGVAIDFASKLDRLDTSLVGGPGGGGGAGTIFCRPGLPGRQGPPIAIASGGVSNLLAGTARHLDLPVPLRDGEAFTFSVRGEPGDGVGLIWNADPMHLFDPFLHGALLVSVTEPHFAPLGTLPSSGVMTHNLTLSMLDPGAESLVFYLQPLFFDTSGALRLGSPASAIVLHPSF